MQGVSKRALQLWKLISIYSENMYSVLNCHDAAKHTELYLGQLRLPLVMHGVSKKSFTIIFQILLWRALRKRLYLKAYKLSVVHVQHLEDG
jgi:hypothetical protein